MSAMWRTVAVVCYCWILACNAQESATETPGGDAPALKVTEEPEAPAKRPTRRRRVEVVPGAGWTTYHRGNVRVDPKEPVTLFRIPVPEGDTLLPARYNITFVIPDPPEECSPNTTLWYSPAVYYEKLCMRRDWMGKCTSPSKNGFRDEQDLIDNYGVFKRVLFEYEYYTPKSWEYRIRTVEELRRRTVIKKTLKGIFCYDDRDYWLAFSTNCTNATFIDVRVSIKETDFLAKWTCRGFNHFMLAQHGSDAFLTSKFFWGILIPFGYFAFLFAVIFSCCYCFEFGARGKATALLHFGLSFTVDDSEDSETESKHHRSKH